jgi:plasmid stabilization system protein ParE
VATVRWTAESQRWLRQIYNYISSQGYADRASSFVGELIDRGESLGSMPERGSVYVKRNGIDVRVIYCGHYRIAYFVNGETVFILGVFNGRMEMENYLKITLE